MKSIKKLQEQIDNLQKEIDKHKKEETTLEVGRWYKSNKGSIAFNQGNNVVTYGINNSGKWVGCAYWFNNSNINTSNCIPATDKEVEEALIKEFKKRYKMGSKFKCLVYGSVGVVRNYNPTFFSDTQQLSNGRSIYLNGKWAEIIENKAPTINGHEMKQHPLGFEFGCARFNNKRVEEVFNRIDRYNEKVDDGFGNRKIKSITLDSGVTITVEELKEIVDYLDS